MSYASLPIRSADNGAWFICDRCSQRNRRRFMQTEWTGLKVCAPCRDPAPPQMFAPGVYADGMPFPDARPPQDNADVLLDDTAIALSNAGVTGSLLSAVPGIMPPGAYAPRMVQGDTIPAGLTGRNVLADDTAIRTGLVPPTDNTPSRPGKAPLSPLGVPWGGL